MHQVGFIYKSSCLFKWTIRIIIIIIIIIIMYSVICVDSRYHIKPSIFIILFQSINMIKNIIDVNDFESLIFGRQH